MASGVTYKKEDNIQGDVDEIISPVDVANKNNSGDTLSEAREGPNSHDELDTFPFGVIRGRDTYQRGPPPRHPQVIDDRFKMSTADLHTYNFTHSRRGDAIIISNRNFDTKLEMEERRGTDRDAENLYDTFQLLGFDVQKYCNVTKKQTHAIIESVITSDHSDADCFALAMLSHGDDGIIYSTDDKMALTELTEPFRADSCTTLAGKPKLFFFQACRGHQLDAGKDVIDAESTGAGADEVDARRTQRIPVMADYLLAYSVVPGYFSWRNSENGSWFIQALCHVFKRYHDKLDLLSMMTRVNRHVAFDFQSNAADLKMTGKKQIPSIVSMLTKDIWFVSKH